jgi:hypothetical protein
MQTVQKRIPDVVDQTTMNAVYLQTKVVVKNLASGCYSHRFLIYFL